MRIAMAVFCTSMLASYLAAATRPIEPVELTAADRGLASVAAWLGVLLVAADMIGNPTQFDLTFRTSRVLAVKGQPLKGATIHTYCAGFLLLCAQATPAPREAFFPFSETPARGNTLQNLATLGMTIGVEFVSPTGAIFSPRLQIVGRREPMYHPGREIQEAIYDHFANDMLHKITKQYAPGGQPIDPS